jgi:hypothetical protein
MSSGVIATEEFAFTPSPCGDSAGKERVAGDSKKNTTLMLSL